MSLSRVLSLKSEICMEEEEIVSCPVLTNFSVNLMKHVIIHQRLAAHPEPHQAHYILHWVYLPKS